MFDKTRFLPLCIDMFQPVRIEISEPIGTLSKKKYKLNVDFFLT